MVKQRVEFLQFLNSENKWAEQIYLGLISVRHKTLLEF